MNTIQNYFNKEKENRTPSRESFQSIINTLNIEEDKKQIASPVRLYDFQFSNMVKSNYFRYSFSLVSAAAVFVFFIINKDSITPETNNNARLAQTTPQTTSMKIQSASKPEVQEAINTIDNIKSFDSFDNN